MIHNASKNVSSCVILTKTLGIANVNLSNIKTGKISAIRVSTPDASCGVLNCRPGGILECVRAKDAPPPD
ncbi:MAG: helix-turn-helix domain-containing protein [Oscillospiraceae bacterium]|nr:helix-turn-helix domain-containing protein [Oscillospiraceae bacterium]